MEKSVKYHFSSLWREDTLGDHTSHNSQSKIDVCERAACHWDVGHARG